MSSAAASVKARCVSRTLRRAWDGTLDRARVIGLAMLAAVVAVLMFSSAAMAAPPEKPVTKAATLIAGTTATLNGELNPAKSATTGYEFTYNTNGTCTEGATTVPGAEKTGTKLKVSTPLTGLEARTPYTFCLVASHTEAEVTELASGLPLTFETLAAKPVLVSESSSGVTPFAATLEAQVNPENQATTSCKVEYGLTTAYEAGSVACEQPSINGSAEQLVSANVSGLEAATLYHYRVVVMNATGESKGADGEFTTLPAEKPLIEEESAASITETSISLSALINPEFQETTCKRFQYGLSTSYGSEAPCEPEALGSGSAGERTSANLTGLTPNTTYHFRVLAENASGLSEGPDQTFLTLPNPPEAITGEPSSISPNSATVSGSVNPESSDTTYFFQYGPTTSYGAQAPLAPGDAGQGTSAVIVMANLTGLEPGTGYHYRIVATNDNEHTPQTVFGADQTLMIVPTPPILSAVSVSAITQSTATITATLDPRGLPTRYELQLGATPGALQAQAFGNTAGGAVLPLTLNVQSLSPGARYYYRLIATNLNGPAEPPPEGAFTTGTSPGLPEVTPGNTIVFPPFVAALAERAAREARESTNTGGPPAKPLTKAQKLAKALKVCAKKPKKQRSSCRRQAKRRYR